MRFWKVPARTVLNLILKFAWVLHAAVTKTTFQLCQNDDAEDSYCREILREGLRYGWNFRM
jgi:hypothetical protein